MKKTILLASLVAQTTTIAAGTTGSVEFFSTKMNMKYIQLLIIILKLKTQGLALAEHSKVEISYYH